MKEKKLNITYTISISGGTGSDDLPDGDFSASATVAGYDSTILSPLSIKVTADVMVYDFKIGATGTITPYVKEAYGTFWYALSKHIPYSNKLSSQFVTNTPYVSPLKSCRTVVRQLLCFRGSRPYNPNIIKIADTQMGISYFWHAGRDSNPRPTGS